MGKVEPACRNADPRLFDSTTPLDHLQARRICATCPCVMACIQAAVDIAGEHPRNLSRRGPHGTWGGLLWRAGDVVDPKRIFARMAA